MAGPDLVEKVARAKARRFYSTDASWPIFLPGAKEDIRAVLDAIAEPSEAMIDEMATAIDPCLLSFPRINLYRRDFERAWKRAKDSHRAMIAALRKEVG